MLMKPKLFLGFWCACLIVSVLRAAAVDAAEEPVEFERATALRIEGKNRRAAEAFERILAVYPDHVAALVQKGAALEDQGKWKDAAQTYRQALKLDPENVSASRNLQQLLSSRMMDTPLGCPNPAKEDLINSGLRALEEKDLNRAIEVFSLSKGLFPDDPRPTFYWACTLEKQGKVREALELYEKTVQHFPDYAPAWAHKIISLLSSGDRKLAQKETEKAREALSDSPELRALVGLVGGAGSYGPDPTTDKSGNKDR